MIKNSNRYVKQVIDIDKFLNDTDNCYLLVSQRPYKGKLDDTGKVILPTGATATLQIINDHSEPIKDKDGRIVDDNSMETFEATIVGCDYPLPFKKGSRVRLGGFLPESSYYINFSLILRFSEIVAADKGKD